MLTRKYYKAIAKIISLSCEDNVVVKYELIRRFIELFKKDNPLFSADKFTSACSYKI